LDTWHFDLTKQGTPLLRLGEQGLRRLLVYGEGSDRYPLIEQTDTLKWELTDTTITIHWETAEDLNRLMQCQLGDFREGVGISPGYTADPTQIGFYATVRAHTAITGVFFRGKTKRRSYAMGTAKARKKWAAEHGREPLRFVSCAEMGVRGEGGKVTMVPVKKEFTPHGWERSLGLATTPKGKIQKNQNLTGTIHPALAQWNQVTAKVPQQEFFLLSFACLAYVYSASSRGMVALGLDLPTFSQADKYHRRWGCGNAPKTAWNFQGDDKTALWCMAALMRLPPGTYPTLTSTQVGMLNTALPGNDADLVYKVLGVSINNGEVSGGSHVARADRLYWISRVPVHVYGAWGEKDTKVVSLQDILIRNLEQGLPWYTGFGDATVLLRRPPRGDVIHGLYPSEQRILTETAKLLESPMEKAIINKVNWMYTHLVDHYKQQPWCQGDKGKPYEMAHRFLVRTRFNRATSFQSLMQATFDVATEAPTFIRQRDGQQCIPPCFSEEEQDWLIDHQHDHDRIRNLFLMGCSRRNPKKEAAKKPPEPPKKVEGGDTPKADEFTLHDPNQ